MLGIWESSSDAWRMDELNGGIEWAGRTGLNELDRLDRLDDV